jgi:hypothetical protein
LDVYEYWTRNQSNIANITQKIERKLSPQYLTQSRKMNQPQMPQAGKVVTSTKIDPITAVQDSIDSFSLSLFEALRGLRDAVSPESSGTDPSGQQSDSQSNTRTAIDYEDMDYDDFLIAYNEDDAFALELVKTADGNPPKTKEEYMKLRALHEMKKHQELVPKLAQNVLSKSAAVDDMVKKLPGMTKVEQMARIQELMDQNKKAEEELQSAHKKAEEKRNEIRIALQQVTCKALSIQEE